MYGYIYNIISNFVESLEANTKLCSICKDWNGKRGPKRRLSITTVISLNLMRYFLHVKDFKAFHRIVKMMDIVQCRLKSEPKLKTRI